KSRVFDRQNALERSGTPRKRHEWRFFETGCVQPEPAGACALWSSRRRPSSPIQIPESGRNARPWSALSSTPVHGGAPGGSQTRDVLGDRSRANERRIRSASRSIVPEVRGHLALIGRALAAACAPPLESRDTEPVGRRARQGAAPVDETERGVRSLES